MSSNLPLIPWSRSVLPFLLCIITFSMYGQGGHKLEISIPSQTVRGGGLVINGGVISSEYSSALIHQL